jgi:hypothetical protein
MNEGRLSVSGIALLEGAAPGKTTITNGENGLFVTLFLRVKRVFGKEPEVIH